MLLLGLFVGSPKPWTFDPFMVEKVEYRAHDCKQNGDRTVCKRALFTFGAISAQQAYTLSGTPATASFVHRNVAGKNLSDITYTPDQCKLQPLDPKGRYLCKHVSWKPHVAEK